jgi:Ca2+/H+ antiporter
LGSLDKRSRCANAATPITRCSEKAGVLLRTLAVSVVSFASGRINVLQGTVHLLLFIAYVVEIFD